MHCGIDEAGRGSVMGPLVVGAVWVDDDDILSRIGVRDSKKLTPNVRERMYAEIIEKAQWTVVVASADEIDELRKTISLNEVELRMFGEAASRYECECVYADCPDVNETRFSHELNAFVKGAEIIAKHKADDTYPVVSAASIIAKVTRDRMIADLHKELGDFGSGYPSDRYTMDFISGWMKDKGRLPPHVRKSWEPIKQMISAKSIRKLDEW